MELKKYLTNLLIRTIISLLLFLFLSTLLKNNNTYINTYQILFKSNIDFSYIKSKTKYLLGKTILNKETYVTSEKFIYKAIIKEDNSYIFEVDYNYLINNLCDGVVVNKTNKRITIDCDDGNTIDYELIENINPNLYSYIKKDTILGNSINNKIKITFKNKKEYLSYENYI